MSIVSTRGDTAQCIALNRSVVSSDPVKGARRFIEQNLHPHCLSDAWFPEQTRV